MSEKDNCVPLFSFFEAERQARTKRTLVIQACVRGAMRAFAEWFGILVVRSTQLALGLAAKRRLRSAIRELQRFDDGGHWRDDGQRRSSDRCSRGANPE